MKRAYPLDGLRAIAVLIVMASHAGLGSIVPGGFGVTIFFFLSGYLITSLMVVEYERSGKIDFAAFYFRRAVRILPPMWIAIAATVAIAMVRPFDLPIINPIWSGTCCSLTNYLQFDGLGSNIPIPLWSLDIEEHYYLAFPFIFAGSLPPLRASRCRPILWWPLCPGARCSSGGGRRAELIRCNLLFDAHTDRFRSCSAASWNFNSPEGVGKQVIGSGPLHLLAGLVLILLSLVIRNPGFQSCGTRSKGADFF